MNIKATDSRSYLNFDSYHPHHTFPSIVYSQMLRYRRIINDDNKLKTRLDELSENFILSGYPKKMVNNIKTDVCRRTRSLDYKQKNNLPPFSVTWVTTYTPIIPQIKDVINDVNSTLSLSNAWKGEKRPVGLVNKRAPNLGNRLFKRRKFALTGHEHNDCTSGTVGCTKVGTKKKGRKCKSCGMMSGKGFIVSRANKKKYITPSATCKTKMLIYVAECVLCGIQYTGRTIQELRSRINAHRGWMTTNLPNDYDKESQDDASFAIHLKSIHNCESPHDFDRNFRFKVVQISDPKSLEDNEYQWISNMQTLQPYGLNVQKPYGITKKFLY